MAKSLFANVGLLLAIIIGIFAFRHTAYGFEDLGSKDVIICAKDSEEITENLQKIVDNNKSLFENIEFHAQDFSSNDLGHRNIENTYIFIGEPKYVSDCINMHPFKSVLNQNFMNMNEQWQYLIDNIKYVPYSERWSDNLTIERDVVVDQGAHVRLILGGKEIDLPHIIFRSLGLSGEYCEAIEADYCNKEGKNNPLN